MQNQSSLILNAMTKKKLNQIAKKAFERRKLIIGDSENDKHWSFDELKRKHPKVKRELASRLVRPVKK